MHRIILFFCVIFFYSANVYSQNIIRGKIVDKHSGEPLPGVNILLVNTNTGSSSDSNGEFELSDIPSGKHTIRFSHIGFNEINLEIIIPSEEEYLIVEMEEESEEIEEVFINATRSSRTIDEEPTRVEVIAGEEIDEKISMDPSNISMILNESTGIQVQQTSAASATNTFRIQGLDGRYTQLLKDGFPLYSGFSGGLSIMQIPPLDLKQVEILKGSSSTLYGGGAIAGLINLISKSPSTKSNLSFLANVTSANGLDLSGYYSKMFERIGVSILVSRNSTKAYDNNDDMFSDLPETERYSLNPKFYFELDEHNKLEIGGNYITEDRIGGALKAINKEQDSIYTYKEENFSDRFSSQIQFTHTSGNINITLKNSFGFFERELLISDYSFKGEQLSTFTEAVININHSESSWIAGVNLNTEDFHDTREIINKVDYDDLTAGIFVQNHYEISKDYSLETGLRLDYNKDYKWFLLPRISLLSKWSSNFSSRIGGGLGYKIPTIFNESSEEKSFRNILPLNESNLKAEKSYGFNFDIDYKTILNDDITFSLNNLFFYTRINDPVVLINSSVVSGYYEFNNFNGYFDTKGIETNLKITYGDYKLFSGYTYTDVKSASGNIQNEIALTPKRRLGIVLIYEQHENFRIGLEAYYTGTQKLNNGNKTKDYWVNGLMIEKHFENISIFLNFENFFDTRQSKYGAMFTGSPKNPQFAELYAPTDGRIINGGIKIKLK